MPKCVCQMWEKWRKVTTVLVDENPLKTDQNLTNLQQWNMQKSSTVQEISWAVRPTKKRKYTFEDEEEIDKDENEDTKMYLKDRTLF